MHRGRRWAVALAILAVAAAGLLSGTIAPEWAQAQAPVQAAAPPPHPAMPVVRFGWEGLAFAAR